MSNFAVKNRLGLRGICALVAIICLEGCCHHEQVSTGNVTDAKTRKTTFASNPAIDKATQANPALAPENPQNNTPAKVSDLTQNRIAPPVPKRAQYANDIDRLNVLSERIKRIFRANYTVVLGAENPSSTGPLISIDYGLFDRLSDDGAAVLIAEAIASNSRPPSSLELQVQGSVERTILQADELVGRRLAKAGFGPDGFAEWLEARKLSVFDLQRGSVPDKARTAAFMRGYFSNVSAKKDR